MLKLTILFLILVFSSVIVAGQDSTITLEIQNSEVEFVDVSENIVCTYLMCESFITIKNLEGGTIEFPAASLFVRAENQENTTIVSMDLPVPVLTRDVVIENETLVNFTNVFRSLPAVRNVLSNSTLRIGAGETGIFRVRTLFVQPNTVFKYNVSFLYNQTEFLLDPFFTTRDGNFSAGTFVNTFLNPGGFVQLPMTFMNGSYLSEIFDFQALTNITNISWFQEINYGAEFPNFLGTESGDFVTAVNMTGNIVLFHMNNDSTENNTLLRDFASDLFNLTCDLSGDECPLLVDGAIFNRSYQFDGINDHFESTNVTILDVGNESFSIAFWINTTENLNRDIVSKRSAGTGASIGVRNTGKIRFNIDEQTQPLIFIESDSVVTDGRWHQVVAVRDTASAVLRIYIDGREDAIPVNEGTIDTLTNSLQLSIGANTGGGSAFNGQLDELSGWVGALSSDQVREHYLRGGVNLSLWVRQCNDRFCFNDNFAFVPGDSLATINLNDSQRFFQFVFNFTSREGFYSPFLYNVTHGFEISELLGGLTIGECPSTTPNIFLLFIVVAIALSLIVFSIASQVGFIGIFGALTLMVSSWFIVGCSGMFGFAIALLAMFLILYFAIGNNFKLAGAN